MKQAITVLSLTCLTALSGALSAVDIKTIFLKMNHARFKESLRLLVGSEDVSADQIKDTADSFSVIDLKNHYMYTEQSSALGTIKRTYVLYFSKEGLPIFVGSDRNKADAGKLTDHFALCQDSGGSWSDCTDAVFPRLTLADLLTSGVRLDESLKDSFFLYYELPRKGTTVSLKITYNDYALEPAMQKQINKELRKFRKRQFSLAWDKPNRRFNLMK